MAPSTVTGLAVPTFLSATVPLFTPLTLAVTSSLPNTPLTVPPLALTALIALLLTPVQAVAWGGYAHRKTAEIAEANVLALRAGWKRV